MTTIKLLSTGLIAIAMLTTSAVARENFAAGRRVIIRGAPSYMVTGPRFREDLCLEAAEAIEARLGIYTPIDPVR
jgi:hypothetical protein